MKNRLFIYLPLIVWVLFCISEWYMWVNTPYSFFHRRGFDKPNLDYNSTTFGDLVAGNIFVTPVARKTRYKTDQFGTRNDLMPDSPDMVIVGDSFSIGAGSDQKDIPAVQLSRLTGKTVVAEPRFHEKFYGLNQMERIALMIKDKQPVKTNVILYYILDGDMLENVWREDPVLAIREIMEQGNTKKPSRMEKFVNFKQYLTNYSPHAIIGRKMKTVIKVNLLSGLYKMGVFQRSSRRLEFFDHDGKVYGFRKIPDTYDTFTEYNRQFKYTLEGITALNNYALEHGVHLITVIIPRKNIAYNRHINSTTHINGYGPGALLREHLEKKGIEVVFPHPEIFKAIDDEVLNGGESVYWSDDTHWSPYGIRITSELVKKKLEKLELL